MIDLQVFPRRLGNWLFYGIVAEHGIYSHPVDE
jgi:hypothetical protein